MLGWYFLPYASVAFTVRLLTRRLADRWGTRPTILVGLVCLGLSMWAYMLVTIEQTLILAAALAGFAHAFLFPATVAEGNHAFPLSSRGLATNLTLTMFDLGLLIGQPVFGWTVETARAHGWDGYFVAFTALGLFTFGVALRVDAAEVVLVSFSATFSAFKSMVTGLPLPEARRWLRADDDLLAVVDLVDFFIQIFPDAHGCAGQWQREMEPSH